MRFESEVTGLVEMHFCLRVIPPQHPAGGRTDHSCPRRPGAAAALCGSTPGTWDRARRCWRSPETGQAGFRRCQAWPKGQSQARRPLVRPGFPGRRAQCLFEYPRKSERRPGHRSLRGLPRRAGSEAAGWRAVATGSEVYLMKSSSYR
jgi:hypothetical protein